MSALPAELPGQLQWRRLHPVTPFVRGWGALVALLVLGTQELTDLAGEIDLAANLGRMLAIFGLVALLVFGYAVLAWRRLSFAIDGATVYKRQGVIFRRERQAPLDRLQAVDIRQPLLARAFGLAELQLEVAGGAGSGVTLGFLKLDDANVLRAELLARAAGLRELPTAVVPPPAKTNTAILEPQPNLAPGELENNTFATPVEVSPVLEATEVATDPVVEPLYTVSPQQLVMSKLRTPAFLLVFGAMVVAAVGLAVSAALGYGDLTWGIVLPILPMLAMGGWQMFQSVANELNFTCGVSEDGIRISRGLFETRFQTIPPGRISAVVLSQSILWRKPNWWRVRVSVVGYQGNQQAEMQGTLLPVGTWEQALIALWLVLPQLGTSDDADFLWAATTGHNMKGQSRSYLSQLDPAQSNRDETQSRLAPANALASNAIKLPMNQIIWNPRKSRFLDPFAWRRNGIAITPRALVMRNGRWYRTLTLVPHERTQSLQLTQGPLERRFGLAELYAQVPAYGFGAVNPVAHHLDQRVAGALLKEQAVRARTARAHDHSERWLVPS